jgi:hypothetical protein
MKIYWKREKIRNQVLSYASSNRVTARRMKSIEVALCFSDLRPTSQGRAHFLDPESEYKGCFAIDLESKNNGKRLICIPKGDFEKKGDMYIEETITELEVIEITDYH